MQLFDRSATIPPTTRHRRPYTLPHALPAEWEPDTQETQTYAIPELEQMHTNIPTSRPEPVRSDIDFPMEAESRLGFVGAIGAGIVLPELDIESGEPILPPGDTEGIDEFETPTRTTQPVGFPETIFSPVFRTDDRPPIDWERVYDEYVILNPEAEEVTEWTDVFNTAIGAYSAYQNQPQAPMGFASTQAQVTGPSPVVASLPAGGVVATSGGCCPSPGNGQPRYMRYCVATGTYSVIRRKRRKDLLTNGDFNNLMRIASLPNKETVKIALAAAIR